MSAAYETFGKYVLLEKLATGGMAEVFLARGTGAGGIGKFFAIKRILPQYADSPEFIDMFKDEAKIAINLSHSNIVSIHEFGVEKGQFFLVMDYVEGRNLRQILNKMKKSGLQFTVEQIVYIIKEVATGLDHAHRCIDGSTGKPLNITHRDMSPQNVMVSFEGEVKIVDFGIAKAESQLETTRAGTLKGKFGYMSPEQAEGQPVDLRTDIFSLGIVMWELLAHDRLFVANNELNTLRKIRDCQIPSLRKLNPNIHTELERIVQKGLARDRNLRYQTGAALHRDLNRFLNRQYPDFSTQDFAGFVKSVFADEILSLRKRLVEYTKVNLSVDLTIPQKQAIAIGASPDDDTSLLDTNTESLVGTDSGGSEPKSVHELDQSMVSIDTSMREGSLDLTKTEAATPTDTQTETDLPGSEAPTSPSGGSVNLGLLDEASLLEEAKRTIEVKSKIQPLEHSVETEEISRPRRRRPARDPEARVAVPRPKQSKPVRFATFLVFMILCLSAYAYLVKYFPGMMSDVIQASDPVLHEFHVALGVDFEQFDRTVANVPLEPPPPLPPLETVPDKETAGLAVTSNPSGAEIFINDRSTGLMTPTQIQVPADDTFNISLRKRGYRDFNRNEVTRESLGGRVDTALTKMNIAYIDVEIFPPQDAILTVNGKVVNLHRSVARNIAVPGNTSVTVRAESRTHPTYQEVVVRVPSDRRKSLQLNPRKSARTPSGSLNK